MKGEDGRIMTLSVEREVEPELGPSAGRTAGISPVSNHTAGRRNIASSVAVVAIAAVMILGAGLTALSMTGGVQEKNGLRVTPMFMTHSPILIEGDAALTAANGVTGGSGNSSDPFIIEGWNIDASASDIAGIAISNLTMDLLIRDVYVHSGGTSGIGIILANLTSCTIQDSFVADTGIGIGVALCDNVTIQNNRVTGANSTGIFLMKCNSTEIDHNIAVDNAGIGIAVSGSNSTSIVGNTMSFNQLAGLALESTNVTVVQSNLMRENAMGWMETSSMLTYANFNVVTNSTTYGVYMMFCQNNTFYNNIVASTNGEGATIMFCENITFYHNDFIDNNADPQASDDLGNDVWNLTYSLGGNFWSDHIGPDNFNGPNQDIPGSDGIVDTPYSIGGTGGLLDQYPLTTRVANDTDPFAFFTYSPTLATAPGMFDFNASLCWDPDDSPGSLEVRWNWESDGTWDTGWSNDKSAQHTFALPGSYNVTMEVRDMAGHSDNFTAYVEVEPFVIQELPGIVIPIVSLIGIVIVAGRLRRRD